MRARHHLALAVLPLALAACATTGTKPKPASTQQAKPAPPPAQTAGASAHKPKVSPYAPAQEDPGKRGDYVAGGLFRPNESDSVPDDIPDVDAIPEPVVRDEPRARTGNRSYSVLGKRYEVLDSAADYLEQGVASYYGKKFHGRRTSSGEVYDMYAFTAAHKTLPLPSYARVTNLDNGKSVVVKINDRGPFHSQRLIDLSYAAAVKLGYRDKGTARVEVRALHPGDAEGTLLAAAPASADSAMDKLVTGLPDAQAPLPANAAVDAGYRFDMHQDGKVMTADEFDAWMQARRVRVATGKPGRPDPVAQPLVAAAAPGPAVPPVEPAAGSGSPPPPAPPKQAQAMLATPAAGAPQVVLQVASFSSQQNAQRALSLLQGAAIDGARLLDADVGGKKVWRLRIGPVVEAATPELAARIVGLGFGQPQRVRD